MARDPKAEVEISAHSRGLGAKLREARAKFGNFGAELKKRMFGKDLVEKGFWGKAGASMIGNLGASAFGAVAGFLGEQGKAVFDFEDRLNRLQIATGKTPEEMRAFAASVRAASNETGMGADQILEGAQAYVALTGDMDGAIAKQRQFAQIAQATGSQVSDIAGAAAALKQNLGVVDDDTIAAFSALATQGKAGAIELKDLAAQLSTIAPQWAMFKGGTGMQGLKELGATLQVVKRGFGGDASQTVTGLQSLLTALVANAPKLKKAKVNVFERDPKTGAKVMRNVLDIVGDISNSKLMKDPTKLEKAFGRVEAYRAFLQLAKNRDALDDLISKSGDAGVIQRDLQARLESSAGRMQVAWEHAKNKVAELFTPERIDAFTGAIENLVAKIGPLVSALGTINDYTFGAAFGLGKSIRGLVSGPTNPFTKQLMQDRAERLGPLGAVTNRDMTKGDLGLKRNAAGYDAAVSSILGAEQGERTTPASIRAAYISAQARGGYENVGVRVAGEQYLRSAGVTQAQAAEQWTKEVVAAIEKGNKLQAEALRELQGGKTMKADGNAIAKTVKNASTVGRRPGG